MVLNIIPSNIVTAFGSNGAVLSSVFLAVAIGLSMNTLGESRTATLRRLLGEVNDVVVVFLNFIVSNFAPFAVFVLLTRTFAIYGIDYLKPALSMWWSRWSCCCLPDHCLPAGHCIGCQAEPLHLHP